MMLFLIYHIMPIMFIPAAVGLISSGDYFGDYYPGREALSLDAHAGYIAGMAVAGE